MTPTTPQSELREEVKVLVHSWFAVDYSGGDITDKELGALEDSIYTLLTSKRQEWVEAAEKAKDNAYWERNQLVAALSKLFPSYLMKHPTTDLEWDSDWRNIVVINLNDENHRPGVNSQLTWHIHDNDLPMFPHLEVTDRNDWDGHTTEEKYQRLAHLKEQS